MGELTVPFIHELRDRLAQRRDLLRAKLEAERKRQSSKSLEDLGGEVRDPGDESAAAERIDIDNAIIERDFGEVRDIDAALARIDEHTYGNCGECGEEIETARLQAYPTAKRCTRCQSVLERQYVNGGVARV